ncbi:hypothetical protein [Burkholderia cepacia]|uniref:hypothetical protein n=2 Tax=Burkholderia cepacia TaxID=292 RepID=UPI0008AD8A70|nr:hypothetical protein [Burkholderia cepacia]SEU47209.1 hypothetical protein SAMN03159335_07685 [Burkholderia cepacia]
MVNFLFNKTIISVTSVSFMILRCAVASPYMGHGSVSDDPFSTPYFAKINGNMVLSVTLPPKLLGLDMNDRNSIKSETGDFKQARYTFPDAKVPRSILHDLTKIYLYDRRRDVPIVSSGRDWVIAEFFRAGSHIPLSRFRLLGRKVERQEQLDETGRTIRIIAIGWARSSTAEDDETTDMSELGQHPVWIRVFKVSPAGKKILVALAWRRKRFATAPEIYDEPDDKLLTFGLPNGTVKWHTKAEFLKAWDIDPNATKLLGRSVSTEKSQQP